jgi:DNA-binding NtrC family response regulator
VSLPVVLAVDDEPDNLSGIRRTLRGRCDVLCAGSGAEALQLLHGREVHLVISDLRMPGMNGVELLEQVRVLSPRTQRVILSAFSDGAELLDAINRGSVLRYLLKPISPEKLREVVGNLLAGHSAPVRERVVIHAGDDARPALTAALERLGIAAEAVGADHAGLLVLDLDCSDVSPDTLLSKQLEQGGDLLVVTSTDTFDEGLRLVRKGAAAILRKPLNLDEAHRLLERAVQRRRLAAELEAARREAQGSGPLAELCGQSQAMRRLVQALSSVAHIDSTVMLRGETGTGKEVAARAIHAASTRADGPFVAVHCAAITGTLLESELFGHEKGAFTGATERRPGRFERAHGGTLFLDEVGDIPLETQVKLLRVLQERTLERVGGREQIPVDVRVVAATHRDLESMIARGQFREDLYYRLKVIPVALPPLRERREDIPELALRFLEVHQKAMKKQGVVMPAEVVRRLEARRWPGNVRELRNEIERLVAFTPSGAPIDLALVGEEGEAVAAAASAHSLSFDDSGTIHEIMDRIEGQVVRAFMERHRWNQTNCAQRLGVTRQALAKKLQKFGITVPTGAQDSDPDPEG